MVIEPFSPAGDEGSDTPGTGQSRPNYPLRYAAAGSLVAGGALLLRGCRRSGLVAAAIGTALTMIDQQETMRVWWNALPVYLDEAQSLLGRLQGAVDDVTAQQEKLRQVFSRTASAL